MINYCLCMNYSCQFCFIIVDNNQYSVQLTQGMFLELIGEDELKEMRLREVLMMMVGYAMSEIGWILRRRGNNVNNTMGISQLVKSLTEKINQHPFITKLYLTRLFPTVLQILNDHIGTQIPQEKAYLTFKLLIVEGLKTPLPSKDILVTSLTETLKQVQCPNHQLTSQNTLSKHQQKQQQSSYNLSNEVCEICLCPFFTNSNSKKTKSSFTLTKCKHQFHNKCLISMINQHILTRNDILFFGQSKQNYQQILTKIKCPHFQSCKVYFNLEEIHDVIGSLDDDEKYLLLDKIYRLAFNQYLVHKGVKSFNELRQKYESEKDSSKDQTQSITFYCNKLGCNTIFEANSQNSNQPTTFICPTCKSPYCLNCFSTIHPTMTCKQYLISTSTLPQDQELQKFIKTLKKPYKKCPKCKFYVDNWRGCSTVKCRCGIQFCFKCGNIGCPHAKCIREIEKEEKEKVKIEQKQFGNKDNKDKERI